LDPLVNLNVAENLYGSDPPGTLKKPCRGELQEAKHYDMPIPPWAGLDFALSEVFYDPFHVNQTRITRL